MHILDLAYGCGIKSMALAQASPAARVTCLDAPEVLEVAGDLAERLQIRSQVTLMPADLLNADLGQGRYQAALLGQITHQSLSGFKALIPVRLASRPSSFASL